MTETEMIHILPARMRLKFGKHYKIKVLSGAREVGTVLA